VYVRLSGRRLPKGNQVNIPEPGRGYCVATQANSETPAGASARVVFSC